MSDPEENQNTITSAQIRIGVILFLAFVLLSILGIQLWNTQVLHRYDYEDKARKQSVRKIRIPPVRGRILSQDGTPIASNRVSWDVCLHPSEMRRAKRKRMIRHIFEESERIATCIRRENPITEDKIAEHLAHSPGIPLTLFQDLSPIELARLWEMKPAVEGMEILKTPVRDYPSGGLAAHLIGYTRQADPSLAEDRSEFNYYVPDTQGVAGLEKMFDEYLRGKAGRDIVMVNSAGFICGHAAIPKNAVNGKDIILTIDVKAQTIAEDLLKGKVGAIVVLDVSNGAVIAMASSPTFTSEDFKSKERYNELSDNPDLPFLNRAVNGVYMPGSVIKPLCGLAAMANGVDPEVTIECKGRTPLGYGRGIACNNRYGHGPMDLRHALKKSCNVYFIENAVGIGIDALSEEYASAGIGRKTGIEIPERPGYLPKNGPKWNENETAFVGFGQGRILVTPLQVALYFAAIANGGTVWTPFLLKNISISDGKETVSIRDVIPRKRSELIATPEALQTVREGLFLVVNEKGGSGVRAKIKKSIVYGKTGTADVQTKTLPTKNVWFAGFSENPVTHKTYSIAVVIERGASGGKTSAPIVGEFFERWFPEPPPESQKPSVNPPPAGSADKEDPDDLD